jgi:DNA repair protein RadC
MPSRITSCEAQAHAVPASCAEPSAREEHWERPRERLRSQGVQALSAPELLALVLRTGTRGTPALALGAELLRRFESLEGIARAGDAELARAAGLGPAKIAALRAALELGLRRAQTSLRPGDRFRSPAQVHAHLAPRLAGAAQEVFVALLLDARRRLIREVEVHRGSLNQSLVHPREVFVCAVRESAASIVVAHNHPSGDASPSEEDREVTRRLAQAGEILGIRLLDHVVIAGAGYTSLAELGELPPPTPPQVQAARRR